MLNGVYHYGTSDGKTEGQLLNPMMASASNPYGAVPGTNVAYRIRKRIRNRIREK